MSEALPLPSRPNLGQYKKLAKDLRKACQSGDSAGIREWFGGVAETTAQAQLIEQRWLRFKKSNEQGSRCTLAGVQLFLAREHGFASWPKFARHVQGLAGADSPVSNFEAAVDAIVSGDVAMLRSLLEEHPELVRARSTREHRSTLLHYVSANGVEDFRQKTPQNIVEITKLLLRKGADVNAESEAYGGGATALGLVATSVHPERAGVQIALLRTLVDGGASVESPSGAGNGHSAIHGCLANGQPKAAEFLASVGATVDFEGAAALGKLAAVQSSFDERGGLLPHASQQQLEAGFLQACGYGRQEVVEFLLERGVRADLQNSGRETGLHRAAYGGHAMLVKMLLECGASLDVRDARFEGTPLEWALHAFQSSVDLAGRERFYAVIAQLARAGAKAELQNGKDPRLVAALQGIG